MDFVEGANEEPTHSDIHCPSGQHFTTSFVSFSIQVETVRKHTEATDKKKYQIEIHCEIAMQSPILHTSVYMLSAIGRSDPSADGRPVGGSTDGSDPSADGLDICGVGGSGPSVDIVLKRRVNL